MDEDIVSTSGEIPEKFIRELHRLATCVKIKCQILDIESDLVTFLLIY